MKRIFILISFVFGGFLSAKSQLENCEEYRLYSMYYYASTHTRIYPSSLKEIDTGMIVSKDKLNMVLNAINNEITLSDTVIKRYTKNSIDTRLVVFCNENNFIMSAGNGLLAIGDKVYWFDPKRLAKILDQILPEVRIVMGL